MTQKILKNVYFITYLNNYNSGIREIKNSQSQ